MAVALSLVWLSLARVWRAILFQGSWADTDSSSLTASGLLCWGRIPRLEHLYFHRTSIVTLSDRQQQTIFSWTGRKTDLLRLSSENTLLSASEIIWLLKASLIGTVEVSASHSYCSTGYSLINWRCFFEPYSLGSSVPEISEIWPSSFCFYSYLSFQSNITCSSLNFFLLVTLTQLNRLAYLVTPKEEASCMQGKDSTTEATPSAFKAR